MAVGRFAGDTVVARDGSRAIIRLGAAIAATAIIAAAVIPNEATALTGFLVAGISMNSAENPAPGRPGALAAALASVPMSNRASANCGARTDRPSIDTRHRTDRKFDADYSGGQTPSGRPISHS
jgi:hypothetical protein